MKKVILVIILIAMVVMTGCSKHNKKENKEEIWGDGVDDINTDVVNTPSPDAIITMAVGLSAPTVIGKVHHFYNATVCYGEMENANDMEQLDEAKKIKEYVQSMQIDNADLKNDLKTIEGIADAIIANNGKDTGDMHEYYKKMHRMFHDLDVFFNGYDRSTVWGVTNYKG